VVVNGICCSFNALFSIFASEKYFFMKRITDFLTECRTCVLTQPQYNGYTDEDAYWNHINSLYDAAISALIEHEISDKEIILKAIAESKQRQDYFDFPSDVCIERIQLDYESYHNLSLLDDYRYLTMAKKCISYQHYFLGEFEKYFLTDEVSVGVEQPIQEESTITDVQSDGEVIRGIRNLAAYLKCGVNKAHVIARSEILKKEGVQFKMGKTNSFNKEKLKEVLSANPDIFKDLHWH